MRGTCLTIARFSLSAWVGAAVLNVTTSVREQVSPAFDSTIKNTLATIRFPAYYAVGFTLVALSLMCVIAALSNGVLSKRRGWIATGLLIGALVLMIADYNWIYQPLVEMITPPDRSMHPDFQAYHTASKHINEIDLALCLIAAIVVCVPRSSAGQTQVDSRESLDSN